MTRRSAPCHCIDPGEDGRDDAWQGIDGGARGRGPVQRFDIVLNAAGACGSVVLQTAYGPDWATLVFHEEWQRLTQDQVVGDLLLVRLGAEARTLLRERLG